MALRDNMTEEGRPQQYLKDGRVPFTGIADNVKTTDHPITPGSAEDYLERCRTELEYNSKLASEMCDVLKSVCDPATEAKAEQPASAKPRSPLADAFAQMSTQLERNNEILRDVLRRLDLP